MCGIAGLWKFEGGKVDADAFDRFVDSLRHRGPDGRGVWMDKSAGLALGHRRLAILDCTEDGAQPMGYANGRYWIVFNGEIFNFLEIRRELQGKGYTFRSQTDTEVILAAYDIWGRDMLPRFNGMWAFVIYDRQERLLFMARDRFGIKPFHYQWDGRQFAFASELKSFKHLEGYHASVNLETASVLLGEPMGVEGTTQTLLKGVQRLQAGHEAVLRDGQLTVRRWWNTLEHLTDTPSDPREQAERFRELFDDSVRLRMRSDVPVGTSLSGGFDSTAVVCALARMGREGGHDRQAREWQQTFVASFPGSETDERAMAEKVIAYSGVKGNFLVMDDSYALRDIEKVLYDFDDVYINLPTNAWMIYQELRRNKVLVSLDGHGADELMGGYKPADFLLLHQAPHWLTNPWENVRRLKECFALMHPSRRPASALGRLLRATRLTMRHHPDFTLVKGLRRRLARRGHPGLRVGAPPEDDSFVTVGDKDVLPKEWGPINRELYYMFHSTILPTVLRNFDRVSMSHGIEIRMPFLDWRLVCFVMSLPDNSKILDGETKKVARDAFKGLIPEEVRASKVKIGFTSPLPLWFQGPLKEWVEDVLGSSTAPAASLVDIPALRQYISRRNARGTWTWAEAEEAWTRVNYIWFANRFLKI